LLVIDGSHKWAGLQDSRFFNNTDLHDMEQRLRDHGHEVLRVPMTLKKGQVCFHHGWTLHASYPNRSDSFRLALAVHLQDGANRYRPYRNAEGREIHMIDEALCWRLPSGEPDLADPDVFPVLWSSNLVATTPCASRRVR
jgi:ectoine hydroxylase-related dioxygenase (phytanoyl-CoA dioxygenase family)